METPDRETAREINTRLRNYYDHPFGNRSFDVYGRLISSLVHLVHGSELAYLTARFTDEDDARHGEIIAFTDTLVIQATITGGTDHWDDGGSFTVEAFSRADLTRMSIQSTHAMFNPQMSPWPGRYAATLTYRDGVEVTLPASRVPTDEELRDLDKLIPTLRADLGRR